mmetsp:Transcript_5410/g.15776  ORF Transcript_5410/g.15776 Transcript_5410/m.15776 type:complete len:100 (+) Transcript_5410:135-434(+)
MMTLSVSISDIACFDGSPTAFAKDAPLIDEIFDAERLAIVDRDNEQDFVWLKRFVAALAEGRNVAVLEHIERTISGIRVPIRNIVGGIDQGLVEQEGLV